MLDKFKNYLKENNIDYTDYIGYYKGKEEQAVKFRLGKQIYFASETCIHATHDSGARKYFIYTSTTEARVAARILNAWSDFLFKEQLNQKEG